MEVSASKAWIVALRVPTLPASVVPVIVGTAAAFSQGFFRLDCFIGALAASLLIQTGTNLANDFFDYHSGADTDQRLGPVRLIQSGVVSANQVLLAALGSFGLAALIGLYLVYVGGLPILLIGLASILAGIAYTGGPYPIGYNGLGDLFVFVFFGLIAVMGTYYLHAGHVTWLALWASIPVGLLVTNILVVNNVRDIETDRAVGKRTLAVRIGRRATRVQYVSSLIIAYIVPLGLWLSGANSWLFWLPWLTAPLAYQAVRGVTGSTDGKVLNLMLKRTGQLHLVFGLLFAISMLF